MFKTTLIALAATLATPAIAQDWGNQPHTVQVSYGDLNLNSAQGIAALDRRIDAAVGRFCGAPMNLSEYSHVRKCRAAAFASARSQRTVVLAQAQSGSGTIRIVAKR
jgi:UrcA family protein